MSTPLASTSREQLQTERLLLRPPAASDATRIVEIAGDWEVARCLGRIPHPYGPSDVRDFLEHTVPRELVWAILLRQSAWLIGVLGLSPRPDATCAELGYYIDRAFWGRGYATEAVRVIVRYGFERCGYQKLISAYFADNPASGRVLAKAGFVITRTAMRHCLAEGFDKAAIELECLRKA